MTAAQEEGSPDKLVVFTFRPAVFPMRNVIPEATEPRTKPRLTSKDHGGDYLRRELLVAHDHQAGSEVRGTFELYRRGHCAPLIGWPTRVG
jgi:hypothetical protein